MAVSGQFSTLAPTGVRSPNRPARNESLYRLSYRGPQWGMNWNLLIFLCQYFLLSQSDVSTLLTVGHCCTWSHSDTHTHSVRLLWTSDQPVAETTSWQHTTLTRDRQPCPRQDSNPQCQQAKGHRPRVRPLCHCDRPHVSQSSKCWTLCCRICRLLWCRHKTSMYVSIQDCYRYRTAIDTGLLHPVASFCLPCRHGGQYRDWQSDCSPSVAAASVPEVQVTANILKCEAVTIFGTSWVQISALTPTILIHFPSIIIIIIYLFIYYCKCVYTRWQCYYSDSGTTVTVVLQWQWYYSDSGTTVTVVLQWHITHNNIHHKQ
jgi:hypothetical protein